MPRSVQHLLLPLGLLWMVDLTAQSLIDSIPYPGLSAGLWGIHVTGDTVFLGADGPGDIYFSDHGGNIVGTLPTGFTYNHGLIKRQSSYLIAKDYTTSGALLQEIDLNGASLNTWTFPPVIGGNSSGIGDIFPDGNAIWYTMYFPDFNVYPFAYAYKWTPGDPTPSDTVPLWGEQPYGIALKGDTLFYVTDNLNGDLERIYAYDLTNEQDLGWVELPDTPIDNDQSPRGMHFDGEHLYLIANRQGNNIFAYQTVFIYDFDLSTGLQEAMLNSAFAIGPNPCSGSCWLDIPFSLHDAWTVEVIDTQGRTVWNKASRGGRLTMDSSHWPSGAYMIRAARSEQMLSGTLIVP
ncbi:MAG: T9SS type A sorting domain-containing protein [Flavobacteriales bacterium]|nr:T9SS type A sorting domain-containing protein [Flavobacteriales bacterium]